MTTAVYCLKPVERILIGFSRLGVEACRGTGGTVRSDCLFARDSYYKDTIEYYKSTKLQGYLCSGTKRP